MPKVSRESAPNVQSHEMAEQRSAEVAGQRIDFVSIRRSHDLAPMLKGLPDDRCQCAHWGYVFAGKLTWQFADHQEVYQAGDAFYAPPGHTPAAEEGTEFVQFSPADELRETEEVIMKNFQAMQGG